MTGFTVDPSGLQSAAPLYSSQASELASIHAALVAGLQAEGECWGNDEAGQLFAAKYVGQTAKTMDQTAAVCGGLDSTAGGVYRWAQNYLGADQAVQADLTAQFES